MRAARITVVVPCVCVCVCVCVRSFLPPHASRPRNIGTYIRVHRDTEKSLIIVIFAKKLRSEVTASFACLLLSSKIRIPTKSTQREYDITIRDFN